MTKADHNSSQIQVHNNFFYELHFLFPLYVLSKALLNWAFQGWCQAQNTVTFVLCETITLSVLAWALCCTEDLQDSTKPWNTHAFLRHQLPRYLQQQLMQFHWWEQEARLCLAPIRFNGSTAQWWGQGQQVRSPCPPLHCEVAETSKEEETNCEGQHYTFLNFQEWWRGDKWKTLMKEGRRTGSRRTLEMQKAVFVNMFPNFQKSDYWARNTNQAKPQHCREGGWG